MRKKIAIVSALMVGCVQATAYAAPASSCSQDVKEMYAQIAQYDSITSPVDRSRFTMVDNESATDATHCAADGFYRLHYECKIRWTMGDWGNTFHCTF